MANIQRVWIRVLTELSEMSANSKLCRGITAIQRQREREEQRRLKRERALERRKKKSNAKSSCRCRYLPYVYFIALFIADFSSHSWASLQRFLISRVYTGLKAQVPVWLALHFGASDSALMLTMCALQMFLLLLHKIEVPVTVPVSAVQRRVPFFKY